jgi:hypothetical protein
VSGEGIAVTVTARDPQAGWQYAHWIVAHSAAHGVERVRYASQEWSGDSGTWRPVGGTEGESAQVLAEVYRS